MKIKELLKLLGTLTPTRQGRQVIDDLLQVIVSLLEVI